MRRPRAGAGRRRRPVPRVRRRSPPRPREGRRPPTEAATLPSRTTRPTRPTRSTTRSRRTGEPRPRGRRSRKAGRRGLHLPRRFKGKLGARARHRARRAREAAERPRGRDDHLRRLLARAGGVRGRAGSAAVHLDAPAGVVGRALDQRGRARRPEPHPGDRREVPPAPAGDRGRAPRPAAAEGPGVRRDRQLPGPALHRRPPDRDARGRHPRRAGQHLRRPPHGADVPGGRVGRVRPGPPADPDGGLAAAPERRELPRLLAPRRDRRLLLPDPRVLRRPARGGGGRGAEPPLAAHDPGRSTASSASCSWCGARCGPCARCSAGSSATRTSASPM